MPVGTLPPQRRLNSGVRKGVRAWTGTGTAKAESAVDLLVAGRGDPHDSLEEPAAEPPTVSDPLPKKWGNSFPARPLTAVLPDARARERHREPSEPPAMGKRRLIPAASDFLLSGGDLPEISAGERRSVETRPPQRVTGPRARTAPG